jgi:eukaryotic-like serine/threonine-protein kinase
MRCPSCGNENREGARFCDNCGHPLEAAPAPAETAQPTLLEDAPSEIDGRYEIVSDLGRGGRKRVYLAHDREADGRDVAVALFETEGIAETAVTRARREAQAMERLGRHAHIVSVLASGEHDGRPYMVSEYMAGGDVAGMLADEPSGRLDADRTMSIATDICLALEHAHARGIVHRDLKPANIWIGDDGRARLGDFGLAATERRSREAAEGLLVGTVAYLPPEQALGRRVDARADLYSLGAVVYEMLTGQPPFPGDDAVAIISRHVNAEPVPPRRLEAAVPPGLDRLVMRLLAKSPDDRPESAAAVRADLGRVVADPDAGAEPESGESSLENLARGVLVGRDEELGEMRDAVEEALAGRGNLMFIVGEPGIGKTRAAEELVTFAGMRGARVLWGRCHEDERAPAFWPWIEAIREFVRDADPVGLRWQLGPRVPDVARLVPELAERLGEEPEPLGSIGEADRFRLFDSVTGFLTDASRSRPLVIVLDDLHWADASSLELLRFASRQLAGTGLLLVGTYRDVELGRHHPLSGALSELTAARNARRIPLRGLDVGGVAAMIESTTGTPPAPALARAIWEQTEGNPFFVGEVVRLLASEGRLDGAGAGLPAAIPEGVRDVVGQRLDRLTPEANDVLKVAAVAGREFETAVVAAASERSPEEVDAALASARENLLVSEGATAGAGWLCFAHAIVRETLYAELSTAQRVQLHKRVGEAIEAIAADGSRERQLDDLARHFIEAAPAGELDKAVDYARRAAARAASQLAHEDAASLYAQALDLTDGSSIEDRARLEIAYELGRARWLAGRFEEARAAYEQAAVLARELGDADTLAATALGISLVAAAGQVDEPLLALLREALEAIDDPDGPTGIQLRSAIAGRTIWRDPDEARTLAAGALESARALGDDHALAVALFAQQFLLAATPDSPRDRLANADELIQVARRAGDPDFEVRAHAYRGHAQLELGDIAAADAAFEDYARLARKLRQPTHLWHIPVFGATRATMDGDFARAEELSEEVRRDGERAQEPLSGQLHALQTAVVRRLQGRLEEALPAVREMARRFPAIRAWKLTLASFLAELGSTDEARAEFEQLAANSFEDVPRDMQWVPAMTRLADTCFHLGDAERAAVLHEMLAPFAGLNVIVGRGGSCQGPVDLYLGRLAITTGRVEQALAHFERAVETAGRVGDRPFLIEARFGLGRALAARGRSGDAERAAEELGGCLDAAEALGMRRMVEKALAARLEAQGLADIDVLTSIEAVVAAVGSERPDLTAIASVDGTVTILFSDIENSTLLNERLGDARWLEVLREHNAVFRRRLDQHGGYEVKSQGDGFMLAFSDPAEALAFAVEVQDELDAGEDSPTQGIRVRMGLHCGEAIAEEGDLFGRSVVLAARIAAQAVGGEILVSEALVERCGAAGHDGFDEGRDLELKGLSGTHRVYRVESEAAVAA